MIRRSNFTVTVGIMNIKLRTEPKVLAAFAQEFKANGSRQPVLTTQFTGPINPRPLNLTTGSLGPATGNMGPATGNFGKTRGTTPGAPPSTPLRKVDAAHDTLSTDSVMLYARSHRWLRKLLVICWSSYLIASQWWHPNSKLIACLTAVLVLGTYRETLVSKTNVSWKIYLAFFSLGTWKFSLQDATLLTSEWEEQGGMMEALMLGMWGLLLAPLLDWLAPWRGGLFKLWIRTSQGRKILVWRGRSERSFHYNQRLMQTVTMLPTSA